MTAQPFVYGGAVDAPLLSPETDAIYLALRDGAPLAPATPLNPHYLAGELAVIAERLECDYQVSRLKGKVECRAGYGDRRDGDFHCVAACVTLYPAPAAGHKVGVIHVLNSAAAARLADRLESGLDATESISRTLAQCESRELSETAVRDLERKAADWSRRLEAIDHAHDPGSDAHVAALRAADREMP